MSKTAYDSDLMAAMREEEKFVQDRDRSDRRIKLDRGQIVKIRFLPAHLGTANTWFARIAKHWLNKKPIVCPVDTGVGFGGNPDAYCPCCRASQELNDSPDERISKLGWEARANSQWTTFCILLEKNGEEITGNEVLVPYEFNHYVSSWEELKMFWKAGTKGGKNLNSILDYETGCDFSVTRTGKGIRLDKDDPRAIFDLEDPNFDKYVAKIEAGIRMQKIHIPTAKELEVFAEKITEESEKLLGHTSGPSRSKRSITDEDVAGEDGPPARRRAPEPEEDAPPARRRTAEPEDAPPARRRAQEPEPEPEEAPPARRRAPEPEEDAPPARTAARRAPAPDPQPEQPEDDSNPELNPAPPKRRTAAAVEPEPEEDAPPTRKKSPPPLPAGVGKKASAIGDQVDDDPEVLPEEAKDAAPPARKTVARAIEEDDAPPPPTTRKLGGANIVDKIRTVTNREKS